MDSVNKISIASITRDSNSVVVRYTYGNTLARYFRQDYMQVEYPMDCSGIPDSILVIPFVANILPIVWLTDAEVVIPELDADFAECIPNVKHGYEEMFPNVKFAGKITIGAIKQNRRVKPSKVAMFYSGGLDSVDTFVRHIDEHPDLLSVWGSDIKYDNKEGWTKVHSAVSYAAIRFSLNEFVIHSQFREFLDEGALTNDHYPILHDNWWHGVQHGLGLLGHVAPLAYVNGYSRMYIASTFTTTAITCASSPLTDNMVRFVGCQVYHDGFECTRQQKVANVVNYCKQRDIKFPLHVCWKSQTGHNCGVCEKCLRTIAALLAEGVNPADFGFEDYLEKFAFGVHRRTIRISLFDDRLVGSIAELWHQISERLKLGGALESVDNTEVKRFLSWVRNFDFNDKRNWRLPLYFQAKGYLRRIKKSARRLIHL